MTTMALSPGGRPADASPIGTPGGRQNWVDRTGGLPHYVRMIAHALMRKGMTASHAIATAVNQLRRLAAESDNPKVKAAAVKALAEWEAKRGAAHAQTAAKGLNMSTDQGNYVDLSSLTAETWSPAGVVHDLAAVSLEDGEVLLDLAQLTDDDARLVLDLAPGDYHPPYDWKHGYIPITPAAALSKAKGDRKRAARIMGGKARPNVPGGTRRRVAGEKTGGKAPKVGRPPQSARDNVARGRGTHTEQVAVHRAELGNATDAELRRHKTSSDAALADAAQAEIRARGQRKTTIAPNAGGGSHPVKADGTPDYGKMSAEQAATIRAKEAGMGVGAKVHTDQGTGTVKAVTSRGITIDPDAPDQGPFHVVAGTPGYGRIKPASGSGVERRDMRIGGSADKHMHQHEVDAGRRPGTKSAIHDPSMRGGAAARPGGGALRGPSDAEKVKNAETMFGTGSAAHKRAQERWGTGKPAGLGQNTDAEDRANAATARKVNADRIDSLPWSRSSTRGGAPAVSFSPKHEKTLNDLEALGLIHMDRRGTSMNADDQYVLTDKGKALVGDKDLHAQTQDRARAELAGRGETQANRGALTRRAAGDMVTGEDLHPGDEFEHKGKTYRMVNSTDSVSVTGNRTGPKATRLPGTVKLTKVGGSPKGEAGATPAGTVDAPNAPAAPTSSTTSSNPDAPIRVEHGPDGTLVHGTARDDTAAHDALRSQGFKFSKRLDAWYLPRTWGESTRGERVRRLEGSLGNKVGVDRTTGPRKSAAERDAETRSRAADRADRMSNRADAKTAEAEARFKASDDAVAGIPFGQPILVGHHSQRRHERALERSRSHGSKGLEATREAQAASDSAERARRTAEGVESPVTTRQRIARKEAELRSVEKKLHDEAQFQSIEDKVGKDHPALQRVAHARLSPAYKTQLENARADLTDEIAHDKGKLDASGAKTYGKDTVSAGDFVQIGGRWYPVAKANAKTVGIPSVVGGSWDDKASWDKVTGHKKAADMTPDELDRLAAAEKHAGAKAALEKAAKARRADVGSGNGSTPKASPASGAGAGAGNGAGDSPVGTGLTPSTARRMSDDQLEKALGRLFEAGGTDTAGLKVLEDELDRRDRVKAGGSGKGEAATPVAADPALDNLSHSADRSPSKITPEVVARMSQPQVERSLATLLGAGHDNESPAVDRLIGRLEQLDPKAARSFRKGGDRVEADRRRGAREQHGTRAQQQADYHAWVEHQASAAQASDAVGGFAVAQRSRGKVAMRDVWSMSPASIRKHASPELLQWFSTPGNEPLPFDAWRAAHLGATDRRAVESLRRRREQWLSEFG